MGAYTLGDVLGGLRIGGEIFSVSGTEAGNVDSTNFENGYGTQHFHYGISDVTNGNVEGVALKLSAKPMENLSVAVEYWRMEGIQQIKKNARIIGRLKKYVI